MQITSPGSAYYVSDCCKAEINKVTAKICFASGIKLKKFFECKKCEKSCNRLIQVWFDEDELNCVYFTEAEYNKIRKIK